MYEQLCAFAWLVWYVHVNICWFRKRMDYIWWYVAQFRLRDCKITGRNSQFWETTPSKNCILVRDTGKIGTQVEFRLSRCKKWWIFFKAVEVSKNFELRYQKLERNTHVSCLRIAYYELLHTNNTKIVGTNEKYQVVFRLSRHKTWSVLCRKESCVKDKISQSKIEPPTDHIRLEFRWNFSER